MCYYIREQRERKVDMEVNEKDGCIDIGRLVVSYYKAGYGVRDIGMKLGIGEVEVEGIVSRWMEEVGMVEVMGIEEEGVSLGRLRELGLSFMERVLSDDNEDKGLKLGVCRILKDMGVFGRRRV